MRKVVSLHNMMLPRLEIMVLALAVVVQLLYVQFYDAFMNWSGHVNGTLVEEHQVVVEVKEFLSPDCDGPPARVWHIPPASTCISVSPPALGGSAALFGRVSCESLRDEDGGFVELCSEDSCSEEGCHRLGLLVA